MLSKLAAPNNGAEIYPNLTVRRAYGAPFGGRGIQILIIWDLEAVQKSYFLNANLDKSDIL